ncbi:MAG: DUF3604 domain-containing protein [Planctomycetota bacterium]
MNRRQPMNRRRFVQAAGTATGVVAVSPGTWVLAGPKEQAHRPRANDLEVVFESSFETGEPLPPALGDYQIVADKARSGQRALMARVKGSQEACFLEIPIKAPGEHIIHVSFWVQSDNHSACAVYLRQGGKRISLDGRVERVPTDRWRQVTCTWRAQKRFEGVVQIVAPSSWNAPSGRMWIDDVNIALEQDPCYWPDYVQDFPVTATDAGGRVWMATVERPAPRGLIRLYRLEGQSPREVGVIESGPCTAIAPPAIAGTQEGVVVAFPVEHNDRWRIAYAAVGLRSESGIAAKFLPTCGTANINPAVAVHEDRTSMLWETNAEGVRRIAACQLHHGTPGPVQMISPEDGNAYNPAVVALEDGSFYAAWDAFREESADIYGAACRATAWESARRLTSDPRIERHPHLAARGNEVWMTWQAQSYPRKKINHVTEQRIAAARVSSDGTLLAPVGHVENVLNCDGLLLRPRVAFDPEGRLWLSARRSLGIHAGWEPLVWCCGATQWTNPVTLLSQQGRWRPVTLAWGTHGGWAVCQFDDLPAAWREQGIHPDWKSGLAIRAMPSTGLPPAKPPKLEPLEMPATDFSLRDKIDLMAGRLPRQQVEHAGRRLTLFWGDFHDHTDLSVCVRDKNPPGHDLLANERDIEGLDFVALTDHGYNYDPPQWAFNGAQVRANHDPARFVTFLGEEWTSDHVPYEPPRHGTQIGRERRVPLRRYGHRNLIFLNPYGREFFDSRDADIPPEEVWKKFPPGQVIAIPHQLADLGNRPTDWSCHDPAYQPVAEIWQTRGSYEYTGCPRQAGRSMKEAGYYLQDAWARGLVIGVIASPDHGGGDGKVGVWATELTREAIFEAVRARHTFGTSGAKMALLLRAGDAMMGDVAKHPSTAIVLTGTALAQCPIRELVIFRNNEIVHQIKPGKKQLEINWTDPAPPRPTRETPRLWYYARIQTEDDEMAWTSPIWFEA